MAGRPPYPPNQSESSLTAVGNPYGDRQHLTFQERPGSAYASTVSLPEEFDHNGDYQDEDETEKVPLTSGGLYPPG